MARSRLLILGLAVTVFLIFWLPLYNCGPIWARQLEGQVIDKATGKPVPEAEVFALYQMRLGGTIDWRWTTTDAEGRFVIPGHLAIFYFGRRGIFDQTDKYPLIEVLHPAYGRFWWGGGNYEPDWSWRNVRIEIERDAIWLKGLERDRKREDAGLCNYMPSTARIRCCELLFGSDAARICAPPRPGTLPR